MQSIAVYKIADLAENNSGTKDLISDFKELTSDAKQKLSRHCNTCQFFCATSQFFCVTTQFFCATSQFVLSIVSYFKIVLPRSAIFIEINTLLHCESFVQKLTS